jgi:5,10-methenyltetrahydromethanopterin hydrogenase
MAAKGTEAKEKVKKIIADAFGQNFIGEYDKKLYINTTENGEQIQVAISLTCPKIPIALDATAISGDLNFEDDSTSGIIGKPTQTTTVISDEEKQNIKDLMERLGL